MRGFPMMPRTRRYCTCWLAGSLFAVWGSCRPAAAEDSGDATPSMTVMSFNIRYDNEGDGEDRWQARRELVTATIEQYGPDLLGTQEVLAHQAQYLRESLAGFGFHGVGRDDGKQQGEFTAVFFRQERFEYVEGGHFWLSERTDEPGSVSWDSSMTRMASWIRVRDRTNQRLLLFVNTHFDHRGRMARTESAGVLATFIEKHRGDAAVVVTGDFNCDDKSAAYERLTDSDGQGAGLVDSYRATHPEREPQEGTFNGFRGRTGGPRIDWILHSADLETVTATIVRDHQQGRYPSDHFPVVAQLRWRD